MSKTLDEYFTYTIKPVGSDDTAYVSCTYAEAKAKSAEALDSFLLQMQNNGQRDSGWGSISKLSDDENYFIRIRPIYWGAMYIEQTPELMANKAAFEAGVKKDYNNAVIKYGKFEELDQSKDWIGITNVSVCVSDIHDIDKDKVTISW